MEYSYKDTFYDGEFVPQQIWQDFVLEYNELCFSVFFNLIRSSRYIIYVKSCCISKKVTVNNLNEL